MAATVLTDNTVTNPDGSTVRTITYDDGSKSVQFAPGPGTPAANRATLIDKATRATAANIADIAACDTISATATFTATQRDNAIREMARQSAVQARQLNVLIKLQLDQLDDTTGT